MQKIFISSTFRDMQAERDAIHTEVVPELRTMAQKYGEDVEVCDLRWGVNTGDLDSEAGSRKVLSVCLDEIDKCKPFMIVILGERYGWIPEPDLLQSAADRKNYRLEEMEKSVTALEIEYGALNEPEVLNRTIFLFREPMPDADGDYQSEGEEYAKKLEALKTRIRKLAGERIFSYRLGWDNEKKIPTGLERFSQIVTKQMRIILEQEWRENAKLSEKQKEEKRHWGFVERKAGQFGGRTKLLSDCKQRLENGEGRLLIMGETGSGKSTLWSKMVSDYQAKGWNVYPFICGNTGNSVSAMDIIKQWIFYVENLLDIGHFEEEPASRDQVESIFGNQTEEDWIRRLRDVLVLYDRREDVPLLLLAADGLDQLLPDELAESFGFLPVFGQKKVYFLLSCVKDDSQKRYDGDCMMIHAMTAQEKTEVLQGMLSYQRKGLDQSVIEEVMKKQGADHPLYLSLLMQRLVMMDKNDFSVIAEYGNDMAAINRYQIELVREAPEDPEDMSRLLVQETGRRVNQELVQRMAEYIAVSRRGLRECDLQVLLEKEGIQWNRLDFSRAVHYMPMLFTERNNGQIDLTHRIIRSGLRKGIDEGKMNRSLFAYLKELPKEDGLRINEIVHYCYVLDEKKFLVEYLAQEDEKLLEKAALELYWICMENSGEWYAQVLQEKEAYEWERNMAHFAATYFWKTFKRNSMLELGIQLKIQLSILQISRKLYQELGTAQSACNYSNDCERTGYLYEMQGKLMEAMETYQEALVISRKLYDKQQTWVNAEIYHLCCGRIGYLYEKQGSLEKALEIYQEGMSVSKKMYEERESIESARCFSLSCGMVGSVYEKQGKLKDALKMCQKGLRISWELYKEQRTAERARDYSVLCERVGFLYEKQGNLTKALKRYQKVLNVRRKLYEEERTAESAWDYQINCCRFGDLYMKQGNLQKALEKYREALSISRKLYEEQQTEESARGYSNDCGRVGTVYEEQGNLAEALEKYKEYLSIARELYEEQGTEECANDYIFSCKKVGNIYRKQGNFTKAMEMYEESLAVLKKVYEEQGTEELARSYMLLCTMLGDLYKKKAMEKYKENLSVYQKLVFDQVKKYIDERR